jgi:chromosomal replication initiation ATPase DnaA
VTDIRPWILTEIAVWCEAHRTTVDEMRSRERTRTVARLRAELYAWLVDCGYSHREIGNALARDRTTVAQKLRSVA